MTPEELNKACEFLNERLYPTVKVLNEDLVDVIDRWELIDEFRKAMQTVIKESLNTVQNAPEAVVKENLTTELTWQDIARIADIIGHTPKLTKEGYTRSPEEFYEEVLQRFIEN